MTRPLRRTGLLFISLALVGCGGGVSDKEALEAYFTKHPDPTFVGERGRIRSVKCHARGITFRGSKVYVCDVHYEGAVAEVCGVRINGDIVTRGLPRSCIP
jgi:hypothetical protein